MTRTDTAEKTQKTKAFKEGMRDSVAFAIPFVLIYLSLGMLGAGKALPLAGVMATTVLIFSTPIQFLVVENHGSGWILVPVIVIMSARFAFMAAAISPHIKDTKIFKLIASSVLIVPSVFTSCIVRFRHDRMHRFCYFLGVGIPLYGVSILCTYIGSVAGIVHISPVVLSAIPMVFPLQVTALSARHWPDYFNVGSYWLGVVLAPVFVHVFKEGNLLLTPFMIGAAVALIENIVNKEREK